MRRAPSARRARRGSSAGRIRDSRWRNRSPESAAAAPPPAARTRATASASRLPWPQISTAGVAHRRLDPVMSRSHYLCCMPPGRIRQLPAHDPARPPRSAAAALRRPGRSTRCSARCRRCSARVPHPVVLAGRAIALVRPPPQPPSRGERRAAGARHPHRRSCWSASPAALGWASRSVLCRDAADRLRWSRRWSIAVLLAQRSLYDHVAAVGAALLHGGARRRAGWRSAISSAAIPASLDGPWRRARRDRIASPRISATAWWRRRSGTLLLGLPGLFAYKMANTLDSMIGHRSAALPRLRLGGGAARRSAQPACRRALAGAADRRRGGVRPRHVGAARRAHHAARRAASTARPMPAGPRRRWPARSASRSPGRGAMPRAIGRRPVARRRHARSATARRHRPRAAAVLPSPA